MILVQYAKFSIKLREKNFICFLIKIQFFKDERGEGSDTLVISFLKVPTYHSNTIPIGLWCWFIIRIPLRPLKKKNTKYWDTLSPRIRCLRSLNSNWNLYQLNFSARSYFNSKFLITKSSSRYIFTYIKKTWK